MFRKSLIATFLLIVSVSAAAADGVPQAVHVALGKLAPGAAVSHLAKAPLPGFYQALVQGQTVYVSADGKYVMAGRLFDAQAMQDLTKQRMNLIRRQALAKVPDRDRVIYAPSHPKYTVTVFTDLDCAYCRVFHKHIKAYNDEGIAVQYLFWPRSGIQAVPSGRNTPSYAKSVSVWCAKDRKKAFTEAKDGESIPSRQCPNPVAREYKLGQRIGVDGTPTIIAEDGSVLGGYLNPQQLLQAVRMVHLRQATRSVGADASAQR